MVQLLLIRFVYAVFAAVLQVDLAALVPPSKVRVIPLDPLVSSEVRMFSIDCAVNAQLFHATLKALETSVPVVSNWFAG